MTVNRIGTLALAVLLAAAAAQAARADGSVLHLNSPCAPADVLGFGLSGLKGSSPVFINGKPVGELAVCDAKSFPLPPGTHNVRVKLAGKSDFGISSDAGMNVTITNRPAYLVMTSDDFVAAMVVDEERGRRLLSDVRTANRK